MDLTAAHPDVLVLVGTQTGNSETVADVVAERLAVLGFDAHVVDMADAYPELLGEHRQIIAVLCTWAEGTYPDNAKDFAEMLPSVAPDLAGAAFGIIGLGDRVYEPYYQTAALHLDEMLRGFGAQRVAEMLEIEGVPASADLDASGAWTERIAEAFASREPRTA